jgi:hypothetical protein
MMHPSHSNNDDADDEAIEGHTFAHRKTWRPINGIQKNAEGWSNAAPDQRWCRGWSTKIGRIRTSEDDWSIILGFCRNERPWNLGKAGKRREDDRFWISELLARFKSLAEVMEATFNQKWWRQSPSCSISIALNVRLLSAKFAASGNELLLQSFWIRAWYEVDIGVVQDQ